MGAGLRQFAAAPSAYLPPPPAATVVDDPRYHLTVSADGSDATVSRLADAAVFDEVVAAAPTARIVWVGTPELEAALRARGCRDQDPPLTSYVRALATTREPPAIEDVEVRRVETFDDFLTGIRVSNEGWGRPLDQGDAPATWARRRSRPGGEWLAYLEGKAVAYAGAIAGPRGLFLTGGVTVPAARGRGAYRALVRARWDEAVRRGTPALVVHAEQSSRPILERLGFESVCDIVELVLDPPRLDA